MGCRHSRPLLCLHASNIRTTLQDKVGEDNFLSLSLSLSSLLSRLSFSACNAHQLRTQPSLSLSPLHHQTPVPSYINFLKKSQKYLRFSSFFFFFYGPVRNRNHRGGSSQTGGSSLAETPKCRITRSNVSLTIERHYTLCPQLQGSRVLITGVSIVIAQIKHFETQSKL